jgi:hypothetical protein
MPKSNKSGLLKKQVKRVPSPVLIDSDDDNDDDSSMNEAAGPSRSRTETPSAGAVAATHVPMKAMLSFCEKVIADGEKYASSQLANSNNPFTEHPIVNEDTGEMYSARDLKNELKHILQYAIKKPLMRATCTAVHDYLKYATDLCDVRSPAYLALC